MDIWMKQTNREMSLWCGSSFGCCESNTLLYLIVEFFRWNSKSVEIIKYSKSHTSYIIHWNVKNLYQNIYICTEFKSDYSCFCVCVFFLVFVSISLVQFNFQHTNSFDYQCSEIDVKQKEKKRTVIIPCTCIT